MHAALLVSFQLSPSNTFAYALPSSLPNTTPYDFVDELVEAADQTRDGTISVEEMMLMLSNIDPGHSLDRDEVHFIMERDLDMDKDGKAVPIETVKKHLHEIHHDD